MKTSFDSAMRDKRGRTHGFDFASAAGERGVAIRVERSGLMAVRAIGAEAQGICSRSPVELQRRAAYGRSKVQLRCGCSVFGFQ